MDAQWSQNLSIQRAGTVWTRCKGWLGRHDVNEDEALWLVPCRAIHTVGMRMAIDVVFLDARARIVKIVSTLPPGRVAVCWRAASVLELAAGTMQRTGAHDRVARALAAFAAT